MKMEHEFELPVGIDETWELLTDLDRIAPCMPGAQLEGHDGDQRLGKVKVKVGPITAEYAGTARFVELNAAGRRAELHAAGRDSRGQGTAQADIVLTLREEPGGTRVFVETELALSGKMAQFGRGVLETVSGRLLDQFVTNLQDLVGTSHTPVTSSPSPSAAAEAPLRVDDLVPARTMWLTCAGIAAALVLLVAWGRRRT